MKARRAVTIIEMVLFGAIASGVIIGIVAILTKGTKILELGRRSSGSQTDFRLVLETLSEDVAELVHLETGAGGEMDAAGGGIKFTMRSSRAERGISGGTASMRRVEYKIVDGDVVRTVTVIDAGGGSGESRLTRSGIGKLKAWPVAAVPKTGNGFTLCPATDSRADKAGATVACLVVEISDSLAQREQTLENRPKSSLVTKLWCRNRVLELARGVLQ